MADNKKNTPAGNQPEGSPEGRSPDRKNAPPPPPVRFGRSLFSWVLIVGILILLFMMLNQGTRGERIKDWDTFLTYVDPANGKIKDNLVTVENTRLSALIVPDEPGFPQSEHGTPIYFQVGAPRHEWYLDQLRERGVNFTDSSGGNFWLNIFAPLLPFLLIILIIWFGQ